MAVSIDLKDQIALVTGASRGIGKAVYETLARAGATVVGVARSEDALKANADALTSEGLSADYVFADIGTKEGTAKIRNHVSEKYGKVEILVNNAAVTKDNLMMRMSDEDFDFAIDVNLKGVFRLTRDLLRMMTKQRYGRIVTIASVVGLVGNAGQANYAASKGGVIALMKTLAREVGSRNITVNVICPGFVDTAMTAPLSDEIKAAAAKESVLGRFGTAEEIAHGVLFLASKEASYVTGTTLVIDGGLTCR
ncbi:MAG: 3-oxoacyl-[acyl-carrier-protein] reductase [Planctomycetes bacterium]|nr:3-oxoacyl-[acyl-carrier-protein] reductase [Planctomycetota bacterium]